MQWTPSARRRRDTWTPIACCALAGGSSPQTSSMRWSVETVSPTFRTRSARIARCRPLPILIGPLGPMASSGPRTLNSIAAIVAFRDTYGQQLDRERDNIRAALSWAANGGDVATGLRTAGALSWYWQHRGHFADGRGWLERLLSVPD